MKLHIAINTLGVAAGYTTCSKTWCTVTKLEKVEAENIMHVRCVKSLGMFDFVSVCAPVFICVK